jgi:hypothetical protein
MAKGMPELYSLRNDILRPSQFGTSLEKFYYSKGTPVARELAKRTTLKMLGRKFLQDAAIRPIETVKADFPKPRSPEGPSGPAEPLATSGTTPSKPPRT